MKMIVLLALSGLATGASAQVVMDFQDLEHHDSGFADHGYSYSANGFTVSHPNNEPFPFRTAGTLCQSTPSRMSRCEPFQTEGVTK